MASSKPHISLNVIVTEGPITEKKILIEDISDKTSYDEFIKKIIDMLDIKYSIISLYFPLNVSINVCVYNSIVYFIKPDHLSIYSLYLKISRTIRILIFSFKNIHFIFNI